MARSVDETEMPPARVDVAVIGGGIIGAAAAFFLARRGLSVALFEKGAIGGEQSGRNWGWIRRMGRDPRELPLARRALHLWPRLESDFGVRGGFARCGIVYLCRTRRDLAHRLAWFDRHADLAGGDIRPLTAREIARTLPGLSRPVAGALFSPHDGRAEPRAATRAFAEAARRHGAEIHENTAVLALDPMAGGVRGVITERGRTRAEAVILAAGAFSRLLLERAGLCLPQLAVINSVATLAPLTGLPDQSIGAGAYAFRRRADGGLVLAHGRLSEVIPTVQHLRFAPTFLPALAGEWKNLRLRLSSPFQPWAAVTCAGSRAPEPFTTARVLDPAPSRRILDRALRAAAADFPALKAARVIRRHAGVIDVLPDAVPVIDAPAARPGLIIATGFSGHGFGLGPAAGELAAALVTGETPPVDPAPFAHARLCPTAAAG